MPSANFKTELSWFCAGALAAFLAGLILGWPFAALILYLAGYVIWLLHRLDTINHWLRSGAKKAKAPGSSGLTDEMIELIHREKKYSRKQKNRYRSTLALFNSLAADLPDATIVVNSDNEIRWSNAAALKLLNINPEKDRGQRIDNLVRIPIFREFLDAKRVDEEIEIPGPVDPTQTLAIRKVHTEKKLTVLIVTNITGRVKLREMRKAFVDDVSHELRTPLTVIRGYLEILLDNDQLDASSQNAIREVEAQSDRMREIVDDLLELSKLEANPLGEQEGESISVNNLVHAMIEPLSSVFDQHTIVFNADEALALLGSEREIYSICNNLITNAVKYTDPGTTVCIDWHLDTHGSAVFSVSDNGPGIEPRHLPRISERFYRVDSARSREQGGTGLGLAIVKHAVQRHGGILEVDSTPGTGSSFSAVFPPNRVLKMAKVVNQ